MAFLSDNAVTRGTETVDTKFSALLEPNLWKDKIFEAGRTFTDRYQTDAMGQLFVRRLGKGAVDTSGSLTFTHTQTADELISIVLDKSFKKSEPIYASVEIARTSGTGMQKFEVAAEAVGEKWQETAHEELIDQATPADNTEATAGENVKAAILAVRKEIRDNGGMPDVLIASTSFYEKVLNFFGKEYQPATNDEVLRTGVAGRISGIDVYESNHIEDDGTAGSTEFIMYEHTAYSILTQLIASRIVDASPNWTGSAAQVEIKSGFKVTTPQRVYKKVVAA